MCAEACDDGSHGNIPSQLSCSKEGLNWDQIPFLEEWTKWRVEGEKEEVKSHMTTNMEVT